jgi:lipid A 3-O-deacylase
MLGVVHRRLFFMATTLTLAAGSARAQAVLRDVEVSEPRQGYNLVLENDVLGAKGSDRWFTNGVHFSTSFKRGQEPDLAEPILRLGRWVLPDKGCSEGSTLPACGVTLTFGAGQNMYTPRLIDTPAPQLRDRPWAGWAYGGVGLSNYAGNRHQLLALKAGPTGPASLAEQAQTWVHRHISDSPRPLGWHNQLRPRLGFQLSYLSTHRYRVAELFGLQASLGGTLGNTRTMARAGAGVYWSAADSELTRHQTGTLDEGEFLVPDFNSGVRSDTLLDALRHTVLYAHAQVSAVAYNVFLQGDTFAGKAQIEPIRKVLTTTLGVAVPIGINGQHKLGLAIKRRSPEFVVRGEVNRDFYQRWGVLTYSYDFDVSGTKPGEERLK